MAGATYFEQSFFSLLWQDVPDFNAELIEIPLGTLSDDQNGFAYENVDGTYTVFLGDVSFVRDLGVVTGPVDTILRLSNIDGPPTIGTMLTEVNGTYSASQAQDAYLDGGTAFFSYIFDGDDTIGFQTPMNLGGFGESPLIETYAGDDVADGSIYDDTIMTGAGNDEVHAHRGDDDIFGGAGFDILDGGFGNDDIFGKGGNDTISGGRGDNTIFPDLGNDVVFGDAGFDTVVYNRAIQAYQINFLGNGTVTVTDNVGNGGTDFLNGVELITFANDVIEV
jgi:Ca2+-binding RTX toxin-like protein